MSNSNDFSGTITGGIQDISALLPLLGTEQCEKHVGSALDRGFLYSSVTPISIFGSLGIVRAAFNILIASINIPRFRFWGAAKLSDGGFTPAGVVAPMIALDPKYPRQFLAETRLEAMLAEQHIENVEDLTVSWGKGILGWNFLLIASTLVISSAGIVPYIRIIFDSQHASSKALPLFPLGFGFPFLRVVGSALCVIFAQFLIQIRVLVLLKTRLLFIAIDRKAKEARIDLELTINDRKRAKSLWNSEVTSEKCIWALRMWLARPDAEKLNNRSSIEEIYKSEYRRQLESIDTRVLRWVNALLVFLVVLGCFSTVVGYVGCFYLIQHASTSKGPLLWLGLEALLSVVRILVWAINPSWDDSRGILYEIQLALHPPLITCNKSEADIQLDGIAPLMRSDRFLEEVVAYTGPFPAFAAPDVTLYYILTAISAKGKDSDSERDSESEQDSKAEQTKTLPGIGKLHMVLSDDKEQTSRILFKDDTRDSFSIYISSLEPVPGTAAIRARVDFSDEGSTGSETHSLTSDNFLMARLEAHYDEIRLKLQKQRSDTKCQAFFARTWAMETLSTTKREEVATETNQPATEADVAYLRQGHMERRWYDTCRQLEEWVTLLTTLYSKELAEDVSTDLVFTEEMTPARKYMADETEFLLIECQRNLEQLLISTTQKWIKHLETDHMAMRQAVVNSTFVQSSVTTNPHHTEQKRTSKIMSRLKNEFESLLWTEVRTRRDNMRNRVIGQTELMEQRIQERKYTTNNAVKEAITNAWKALPDVISSESARTGGTANNSSARIVTNWREFEVSMRARYNSAIQLAKEEVKQQTSTSDEKEHRVQLARMKTRCRQRANRLFSRLEAQEDEFKDLYTKDVLTADSHPLVDYWSSISLQERLRLQDRRQKFLKLSNTSVEAVGGRQNMLRALKRSQDFAFIDTREASLLTNEDVISVIKSVTSVTGVRTWKWSTEVYEVLDSNVKAAINANRDVCCYVNMGATDYHLKGSPYLIAPPDAVACIVCFYITTKSDHTITLCHTKNGKLNLVLNGRGLQSLVAPSEIWHRDDIYLPNDLLNDVGQLNMLEISVDKQNAPYNYWLSDILLPVQPVQVVVEPDTITPANLHISHLHL
ncbi:hypothetical protein D9619_000526 [Psilocybe cf. subviscida]|uniref:Uncharacterized protein n=1 Tax=Psilocybe cf. subviscida TaxID=2480587 RepID=A0A8H5F387_9AGAR|nr:hypothetical protein D9619_000526 [Psilocybe cf. subviscida]